MSERTVDEAKSILTLLKDETEAGDLEIVEVRYVTAQLAYLVDLKAEEFSGKAIIKRKWVDDYCDSNGRDGKSEILSELVRASRLITTRIQTKRKLT